MGVKAFELITVTESINIKIQCIEASGNDLYIGSLESTILHLSVEERTCPSSDQIKYTTQLLQQKHLGTTKKPIVQIKTASALCRLLALSDGNIYLLDSEVLSSVGSGPKLKNVVVFCVNENPNISDPFTLQFCIAKKRCLQICSLHEDKISILKEISTQDPLINMAMDGNFVCVAGNSQYCIYNIESGFTQDLFPCDSTLFFPLIKRISKEEFLVMAPGNLGMFVTSAGTSERPPVQWGEGILSVSYYHPYVITITSSFIRIYSLIDQQHKQTLLLNGGLLMGNFDGQLYVATDCSLHCLMPQPWTAQVMALLENESVGEAIELLEHSGGAGMSGEKYLSFSQRIFQQSGFIELLQCNFTKAQDYFISGKLDIRELLSLYPGLLPCNLEFLRSQPPLHSMVDINQAFHLDNEKIEKANNFLLSFLILLRCLPEFCLHRMEVDTALIKIYSERKADELLLFLETEDIVCALDECAQILRSKGHYAALAKLYRHFGKLEECLELMTKLSRGEISDSFFQGVSELVDVIVSSSDESLLWRFANFVLDANEAEGLRMICEFKIDVDPHKILKCLLNYPKLRIKYLNHLIYNKKFEDEKFHTELVLFYINDLIQIRELDEIETRKKLQDVLQTSAKYNPRTVLSRLLGTHLLLEQTIVYGKLNLHEKALSLLVCDMKDFTAAERYCVQHSKLLSQENKSSLFSILLRLYLKPPPGASPDNIEVAATLNLLSMHSSDLNLYEVLDILPPEWSVTIVEQYLKGALRANMNKCRMKKLQLNLLKSFNIRNKFIYLQMCNTVGPITLTVNSVCSVCEKGFKNCDFSLYPNGVLTHPACAKNPNVCPLTGTIFKVQNDSKHNTDEKVN